MREIEIYPDAEQLTQAAAEQFTALAQTAINERGRFTVALSGGSTPRALFQLLATDSFTARIDWSSVQVFWGDERGVPPEHPDSNYRMASETLLDYVPVPESNVHRMQGELDPTRAANAYSEILRQTFEESPPVFDLILLGMGDDGHTASLFPGTAAVYERNRWVVGHFVGRLQTWRITLTPVVINAARTVLFLVSGANKAERLKQVLEGAFQPHVLPAQIVQPRKSRLLWLVDKAAAAKLK
jgi:6-phosphogluconolactonase